jgi:outer membrane protein
VQGPIVFVDLDSVFTNYYKTRDAEAQLKVQAEEIKSEREGLMKGLEKLREEYAALKGQSQSAALNDDARNVKRAQAEDKLLEMRDAESKITRMEETAQRRINEQSRRARTTLVEEINVIIKEHASTRGYLAIIDTSGSSLNGVPSVVYYNPKYDVTAEIISRVNAKSR